MTTLQPRNATAPQPAAASAKPQSGGLPLPVASNSQRGQRSRCGSAYKRPGPVGSPGRSVGRKGPVPRQARRSRSPCSGSMLTSDSINGAQRRPARPATSQTLGRTTISSVAGGATCGCATNEPTQRVTNPGDRPPEGISSVADLKGKVGRAEGRHGRTITMLLLVSAGRPAAPMTYHLRSAPKNRARRRRLLWSAQVDAVAVCPPSTTQALKRSGSPPCSSRGFSPERFSDHTGLPGPNSLE